MRVKPHGQPHGLFRFIRVPRHVQDSSFAKVSVGLARTQPQSEVDLLQGFFGPALSREPFG